VDQVATSGTTSFKVSVSFSKTPRTLTPDCLFQFKEVGTGKEKTESFFFPCRDFRN
jgi:hypothetical protein